MAGTGRLRGRADAHFHGTRVHSKTAAVNRVMKFPKESTEHRSRRQVPSTDSAINRSSPSFAKRALPAPLRRKSRANIVSVAVKACVVWGSSSVVSPTNAFRKSLGASWMHCYAGMRTASRGFVFSTTLAVLLFAIAFGSEPHVFPDLTWTLVIIRSPLVPGAGPV